MPRNYAISNTSASQWITVVVLGFGTNVGTIARTLPSKLENTSGDQSQREAVSQDIRGLSLSLGTILYGAHRLGYSVRLRLFTEPQLFTTDSMHKVFISSTWIEMQSTRQAIAETLHKMNAFTFVGMEHFGSRPESPERTSLDSVDESDVYVCIVGDRYGSGITEKEYDRARRLNLPCFIYFLGDGSTTSSDDSDLVAFSKRLRSAHTCSSIASSGELALGLATDLYNWLFTGGIDDGLGALAGDYRMRVQNFVAEYLGSRERKVPFGGRDSELASLKRWLDDDSSPFMLVAAAAGRGKSALLVEWAKRLQGDSNVAVVFFPVSIRFRTNLSSVVFCSIATFLARLHGERLSVAADSVPEVWRGLMLELLWRPLPDGRRLVLIVDGLDEAADWQAGPDLFPAQIRSSCKVVVSARLLAGDIGPDDWRARLGWEHANAGTLELPLLAESAVRDVLLQAGMPLDSIAANHALVGELHRLSEGDPLLVRLYVSELWSRGDGARKLTVDDLREIEPGFDGFLKRWWDEQRALWGDDRPFREASVQAIAGALACAFGPLTRDDLLSLVGDESGLSSWDFDDALAPLRRFIVGDGEHQGHVFSHPRLAVYFRDRLSARERDVFRRRFLAWGSDAIAKLKSGAATPDGVSPYLVQYYTAHLVDADAEMEQFSAIATKEWLTARHDHDGTYAGYGSDLRVLADRAAAANNAAFSRNETPAHTGLQIKCLSALLSIDEIGRNTPPRFIIGAIKSGLWPAGAAAVYAGMIEDPVDKARVFLELAQQANGESRSQMLESAKASMITVEEFTDRPILGSVFADLPFAEADYLGLCKRYMALCRDNELTDTLPLLQVLSPQGMQSALSSIIELAPVDLMYALLDAISEMADVSRQPECLRKLGEKCSPQVIELADRAGQSRFEPWQLVYLLLGAAESASLGGQAVIDRAVTVARSVTDRDIRVELLVDVCAHECNANPQLFDDVVPMVLDIKYAKRRARLLTTLASNGRSNRTLELTDRALDAIETVPSEAWRAKAVGDFAPLINASNAGRVMAVFAGFSDGRMLADAVAHTIAHLPDGIRNEALACLADVDDFTRLTAFAFAPEHAPRDWVESILQIDEQDFLSEEWVYTLLRCFAPAIDSATLVRLLAESSSPAYGACPLMAAAAAVLPFADQDEEDVLCLVESAVRGYGLERDGNNRKSFLDEVVAYASPDLRDRLMAIAADVSHGPRQEIAAVLAPYMEREVLQEWIRSCKVIGDWTTRRAFYTASLARLGGRSTRSQYPSIWAALTPADEVSLMLHDLTNETLLGFDDAGSALRLIEGIADRERRAFLFREILKHLGEDSIAAHWHVILAVGTDIGTGSVYAREAFSVILNNAPAGLKREHLERLLARVDFFSHKLDHLFSVASNYDVLAVFKALDRNRKLDLLLNTNADIEFDIGEFVADIEELEWSELGKVIELCIRSSNERTIPWPAVIAAATNVGNPMPVATVEDIVRKAPPEYTKAAAAELFAFLRTSPPNVDVADKLFQDTPAEDVVELIAQHWEIEVAALATAEGHFIYDSIYRLANLADWAIYAAGSDLDALIERLASMLANADESQRMEILCNWVGNSGFIPAFLDNCCEFSIEKRQAVVYLRLFPYATAAQVQTMLDWLVGYIDADLPRALRTFGGMLYSNDLDRLEDGKGIKMAVLIELISNTEGPAQQHVAHYTFRVLMSMDEPEHRGEAAIALWGHLPPALRSILEATCLRGGLDIVEFQDNSRPAAKRVSIDADNAQTPSTKRDIGEMLRAACETGVLPDDWRDRVHSEIVLDGRVKLANALTASAESIPCDRQSLWSLWQGIAAFDIGSNEFADRRREVLIQALDALLPVTFILLGAEAVRDQMMDVDEVAGWWL